MIIIFEDIREWLESLEPDTIVQTEGKASCSCVVTNYVRNHLGFPYATTNGSYASIDGTYKPTLAEIEPRLTEAMLSGFDCGGVLTAKQALEIMEMF